MNIRYWLALFPLACSTVAAADPLPFAPTAKPTGLVAAAFGKPLVRGVKLPSRARGDAFGLTMTDRPAQARLVPPYVDTEPLAVPDTLEVVFYARSRPVRIRIVVSAGEKSFIQSWDATLKALFAVFDRDRDGYLNRYELEQIFSMDAFSVLFNGGFYSRIGSGPPALEVLDRDGDNRISFAEFARYYRPVVADLVKARALNGALGDQDNLTKQLFARLDANNDGNLSKAELLSAERILLALDADEDECVSMQELLANTNNAQSTRVAVANGGMAGRPTPPPQTQQEVAVFTSGIPGSTVQQIIKRYDKNGDYELTAEEVGFDPATFARLDRNGDKKLSATELDAWRNGPPDIVVDMAFNGYSPGKVSARPTLATWPVGIELRQTEPTRLVLRIGTQTTEFSVFSPPKAVRQQQIDTFTRSIFPPGKDVVDERELVGPQNQFVRVIFDAADFNADGKLTRAEFEQYFALQKTAAEAAVAVSYVVRTPNLFQMLDENGDGKLGVRELRTAWDRMIVLEPAGSQSVTKSIMQPSVNFRLSSSAYAGFDQSLYNARGTAQQGPANSQGPIWFTKMDRNGDGDVSRAEFLGTDEDFAKLDTNKDGLISLAEAKEYEKLARPGKGKK